MAALGNMVKGLHALIPMLLEMGFAAGLFLHANKTKLLNLSDHGDFEAKRGIADIPMASSFEVSRRGAYLGVPMGTDTVGHEFDAAIVKYRSRCLHIRSVPGFVVERLRAHQVFVVLVISRAAR